MVAAAFSGPRRRRYGGARDLVIGMNFATLEGKLVETGGMVVKNVAGLDMVSFPMSSPATFFTTMPPVSTNLPSRVAKVMPMTRSRAAP